MPVGQEVMQSLNGCHDKQARIDNTPDCLNSLIITECRRTCDKMVQCLVRPHGTDHAQGGDGIGDQG